MTYPSEEMLRGERPFVSKAMDVGTAVFDPEIGDMTTKVLDNYGFALSVALSEMAHQLHRNLKHEDEDVRIWPGHIKVKIERCGYDAQVVVEAYIDHTFEAEEL